MTPWVKLENCQWRRKILEWLSKFGKPLTLLEEKTPQIRKG
jgi:hypothetical protein